MLLQAKKNKRGISMVIGYILLIAISIVMSIIVFQWLKTYVPKESINCPEGTSIFIKEVHYNCTKKELDITIRNNGKFGIDGYFIHVSNKSDEEIATIDISSNITEGGIISGSSVRFSELIENALSPGDTGNTITSHFNVAGYGTLYKVEIIPTRIQEEDNKKRVVSCSNAKTEQDLACS